MLDPLTRGRMRNFLRPGGQAKKQAKGKGVIRVIQDWDVSVKCMFCGQAILFREEIYAVEDSGSPALVCKKCRELREEDLEG